MRDWRWRHSESVNVMAQSIAAGRAWQRLHLAATAEGIAAQPLNQPVEMIRRGLLRL
jgi:hypothetical protein